MFGLVSGVCVVSGGEFETTMFVWGVSSRFGPFGPVFLGNILFISCLKTSCIGAMYSPIPN